jgi:hypothetical protein
MKLLFGYHLFHADLFLILLCELLLPLARKRLESCKKQKRTLFKICLKIVDRRKLKVQKEIKMHVYTNNFFLFFIFFEKLATAMSCNVSDIAR